MLNSFEDFFASGGPIGEALPGYQLRGQQVEAASAVTRALARTGAVALVEAGTGVGKTLAYLIPALLHARPDRKAVISTHTLALQAQLWERDIPLALSLQPKKQQAAILKGRGNYLCLQEMNAATTDLWAAANPLFAEILQWAEETETGDQSELSFYYADWPEISAHPDTCRGAQCRYFDSCFYFKAKRHADEASLLLVNHALYFSDLALRRSDPQASLLPDHSVVIFDEAHHLESTASKAFGVTVSSTRPGTLLKKVRRLGHRIDRDEDQLQRMEREFAELFSAFYTVGRLEFAIEDVMPDLTWAREKAFAIAQGLQEIASTISGTDTGDDCQLRESLDGVTRQTVRLREELLSIFNGSNENVIKWGSVATLRDHSTFVTLNRTPISIAPMLRESLWNPQSTSAALLSATLATNGGFSFLRERLGLNSAAGDSTAGSPDVIEVIADSPFEYAKNCRLYVPDDLPDPSDSFDYNTMVAAEIQDLVYASSGGAFLLFTSHRMLHHVYALIEEARMPYPLFRQGQMPAGRLVEEFRESSNGVLLGTQSFWEGVDVPGESLRLVVVDRLPFGSPDSPVHKARVNAVTRSGGDWFNDLVLPMAQLRLKQGFGRLIRSSTDRGVVAILDNRLNSKSYGRKFLQYLPQAKRVSGIDAVREFYLSAN